MTMIEKRLFKHGGSYALDLPKEFLKSRTGTVLIKYDNNKLVILKNENVDNIESEPEFKLFVKALVRDALTDSKRLKDLDKVWDKDWDNLLKDVKVTNE